MKGINFGTGVDFFLIRTFILASQLFFCLKTKLFMYEGARFHLPSFFNLTYLFSFSFNSHVIQFSVCVFSTLRILWLLLWSDRPLLSFLLLLRCGCRYSPLLFWCDAQHRITNWVLWLFPFLLCVRARMWIPAQYKADSITFGPCQHALIHTLTGIPCEFWHSQCVQSIVNISAILFLIFFLFLTFIIIHHFKLMFEYDMIWLSRRTMKKIYVQTNGKSAKKKTWLKERKMSRGWVSP